MKLMAEFRQDLRHAVRMLARSPGFSAAAILTLAVAIGGNTALFSVANALLFKPMPIHAPEEVTRVRGGASHVSWRDYEDLGVRTDVFAEFAAHRRLRVALTNADGLPVRLEGEQTSFNFFDALAVAPALGRTYASGDSRRDVVVLADHTWRARFGAAPDAIGRVMRINGHPYEVVAVMPAGFRALAPAGFLTDVWLPVDDPLRTPALQDRRARRFEVFGRLRTGATREQAAAAMLAAAGRIRADNADASDALLAMEVFPVSGLGAFRGMGDLVIPVFVFLAFMIAVAGVVLLIGCANIAGLLLGRAAARQREVAIRLALGSARGRLVRQLLTESLLLALLGGAAGVVLSIWLTRTLGAAMARLPVPMAFDLQVDYRITLYALALSGVAAMVCGLAPARRAARFDVVSSLKETSSASPVRQRLRRALVLGQVAACSALLVWSGLFARSLGNIARIDPGFDPSGVLLGRVEFDDVTQDAAVSEQMVVALQQRVESQAGVESIGVATVVPLSLENEEFDIGVDGQRAGRADRLPQRQASPQGEPRGLGTTSAVDGADGEPRLHRVMANRLTPGWFQTVRIPIVAGRDFAWSDRRGAADVAIVNETLSRRIWNGDALGRSVTAFGRTMRVVGVVRDSKYWTLGESPQPTIYLPFQQHYFRSVTFHVRTTDLPAASTLLRSELQRLTPDAFIDFSPMADVLTVAMLPARIGAATTGAFGVLAMLLAALGVFGLVAFNVAQRRGEIGVRKVVGAGTAAIVRLILAENVALTATGLGIGLGVGMLGAVLLRSFIANVSPLDPVTLIAAVVVVMTAAAAATAVPAIRAARVNPLTVLREA